MNYANYFIDFLTWKAPGALEATLFCYVLWLAAKLRAMEAAKGHRFFWFQSIARHLMLSFGGGICVPVALGFRPFPLANDAAVTLLLLAWWLMHYCPGDAVYKAFTQAKPLRVLLVCGFEVARCNVIVTWLTRAHEVIPPGKYYPVAVWGPVLSGWLAGCFGGFLHGGLDTVSAEVAWLVQSALYAAVYFQLAVYDPHTSATLMAASPLPWLVARAGGAAVAWRVCAHVSAVLFLAGTAVLQEAGLGKDFNPFAGLHAVAYAATGIPSKKAKAD